LAADFDAAAAIRRVIAVQSDESEQKFFVIHPTETMWLCFQPRSIEMKRID
jgi:hypothetical protein